MSRIPFTEPGRLQEQYGSMDRLAARIRLHKQFGRGQDMHAWMFEHLQAVLPAEKPARILELGCGRGDVWAHHAAAIPPEWQVTLTDFSPGMLDDCRAFLGPELAERFSFGVVDIQNIPYPDAGFDVVIANMMLYHVPDRARALAEARRVLHPEGVFFTMTSGQGHMAELYELAARYDPAVDPRAIFAATFSLQNGVEQLRGHFAEVQMDPLDSQLVVTEVQPLLDYIASMMSVPGEKFLRQHESALRAELEQHIADKGAFYIGKETGLFIARGFVH